MTESRKSLAYPSDSDLSEVPLTQRGDLIQLDSHRIICGDATSEAIVAKLLGNERPQLMVTEPPYENNYSQAWKERLDAAPLFENPFLKASFKLFPGNVCYVWHSSFESSKVEKILIDLGFKCHSQIIWAKNHCEFTMGEYHWQHEPCWYALKRGQPHIWKGSDMEATLWSYATLMTSSAKQEDMRTIHPGQKPLECMARPIRNNSAVGDAIYDPFCGSGSTLIACEKLERRCYAVEIFPKYCDAIIKRWIRYRLQQGVEATVLKNGVIAPEYSQHS